MRPRNTQNNVTKTLTTILSVLALVVWATSASAAWLDDTQPNGNNGANGAADTQPKEQEAAPAEPIVCTVTKIDGKPMYRAGEDQPWQPLAEEQVLPVGTEVRTALRDKVHLSLGPNADVVIDRLTHLTVGQLDQESDSIRTMLAVQRGKVDFHVKHVGFRNDFKIATPTGTMAVRGTEGSVVVDDQTSITGNENNGGNAIGFGSNNTGNQHDLSGNQQYNNGEVTGGENYDTGSGRNDNDNTNSGDGNGNGAGNSLPNTDSLHGNTNFNKDIQDFLPPGNGNGNNGEGGNH